MENFFGVRNKKQVDRKSVVLTGKLLTEPHFWGF